MIVSHTPLFPRQVWLQCYYFSGNFLLPTSNPEASPEAYRCSLFNLIGLLFLGTLPYYWRIIQCTRRYFADPKKQTFNLINIGVKTLGLVNCAFFILDHNFPGRFDIPLVVCSSFAYSIAFVWDVWFDWYCLLACLFFVFVVYYCFEPFQFFFFLFCYNDGVGFYPGVCSTGRIAKASPMQHFRCAKR